MLFSKKKTKEKESKVSIKPIPAPGDKRTAPIHKEDVLCHKEKYIRWFQLPEEWIDFWEVYEKQPSQSLKESTAVAPLLSKTAHRRIYNLQQAKDYIKDYGPFSPNSIPAQWCIMSHIGVAYQEPWRIIHPNGYFRSDVVEAMRLLTPPNQKKICQEFYCRVEEERLLTLYQRIRDYYLSVRKQKELYVDSLAYFLGYEWIFRMTKEERRGVRFWSASKKHLYNNRFSLQGCIQGEVLTFLEAYIIYLVTYESYTDDTTFYQNVIAKIPPKTSDKEDIYDIEEKEWKKQHPINDILYETILM